MNIELGTNLIVTMQDPTKNTTCTETAPVTSTQILAEDNTTVNMVVNRTIASKVVQKQFQCRYNTIQYNAT